MKKHYQPGGISTSALLYDTFGKVVLAACFRPVSLHRPCCIQHPLKCV